MTTPNFVACHVHAYLHVRCDSRSCTFGVPNSKQSGESNGRVRSVSVFANMLNITPKYLSKCVKGESGRSPLDLIHETTVGTIRQQLRYSNKTVKEICTELDFPNLSFFGKFVKEHLGLSPTAYRQQNLNNECRLHPEQGKQT